MNGILSRKCYGKQSPFVRNNHLFAQWLAPLDGDTVTGVGDRKNESRETALIAWNLRALIDYAADHPELGLPASNAALERASGLSRQHIGRILAAENAPAVDVVGDVAHAYGLEAWELLVSRLDLSDPRTTRRLRAGTSTERAAATVVAKQSRESQPDPEATALVERLGAAGRVQKRISHEIPAPQSARADNRHAGTAHSKKVPASPRKPQSHKS